MKKIILRLFWGGLFLLRLFLSGLFLLVAVFMFFVFLVHFSKNADKNAVENKVILSKRIKEIQEAEREAKLARLREYREAKEKLRQIIIDYFENVYVNKVNYFCSYSEIEDYLKRHSYLKDNLERFKRVLSHDISYFLFNDLIRELKNSNYYIKCQRDFSGIAPRLPNIDDLSLDIGAGCFAGLATGFGSLFLFESITGGAIGGLLGVELVSGPVGWMLALGTMAVGGYHAYRKKQEAERAVRNFASQLRWRLLQHKYEYRSYFLRNL